jgi:hypothetical protein
VLGARAIAGSGSIFQFLQQRLKRDLAEGVILIERQEVLLL